VSAYPDGWRIAHQTRGLAGRWRKAELITEAEADAIRAEYACPYTSLPGILAWGVFGFSYCVVLGAIALVGTIIGVRELDGVGKGVFFLFAGVAVLFGAEWVIRRWRLMHTGIDDALQFVAAVTLWFGGFSIASEVSGDSDNVLFLTFIAALGLIISVGGLIRYRGTMFLVGSIASSVVLAGVVLFRIIGIAEDLRVTTIMALLWIMYFVAGRAESADESGAWRRQYITARSILLSVFYLIGNEAVATQLYAESEFGGRTGEDLLPFQTVHLVFTAGMPVTCLWLGIVRRRRVLIRVGVVTLIMAVFTFQNHFFEEHVEVFLVATGAFLIIAATMLRNALRRPRRGFTSEKTLDVEFDEAGLNDILYGKLPVAVASNQI